MNNLTCRCCSKTKPAEYCPSCGDNRYTSHKPHGIRLLSVIWAAIITMMVIGVLMGMRT